MQVKKTSKSSLFLMELIIVILFFAITSAICVRLFVGARQVAASSRDLTHAAIAAQSAAEAFKGCGTVEEALALLTGDPGYGNGDAYYSVDWEACAKEDAAFRLELRVAGAAKGVTSAEISVYPIGGQEPLFHLSAKKLSA